jgi:hypothetical protein
MKKIKLKPPKSAAGRKSVTKIEGGYCLIGVGAILACWQAYQEKRIQFRDVRAWLACCAIAATRCTLAKDRPRHFRVEELLRLAGGKGLAPLQASLRRLEAVGLLVWSESAIAFPKFAGESWARRLVPVPRRTLRYLAKCRQPALVATVLGLSVRCLRRHRDGRITFEGTCKASWIVEHFGVSLFRVKKAREYLEAIGWLQQRESPSWKHRQQNGASFAINLSWLEPSRKDKPQTETIPRKVFATPKTIPPLENKELLTESGRYQKLGSEPSGVQKRGPAAPDKPHLPEPMLRNVRLEDLCSISRLLVLYQQAVALGYFRSREASLLSFFAASVKARRGSATPVPLFVWTIKNGFRNVSGGDEDYARAKLVRYREANPEGFRL